MRDLVSQITVIKNIVVGAKAANTAVNGAGLDTANRDAVTAVLHVETWTDGTHTPKLQESVDNSTWTDVALTDIIGGAFTAVTANGGVGSKQLRGYLGKQRYLRVVLTTAGASTGAVIGADFITTYARKQPQ